MALFKALVTKWQTGKHENWQRVRSSTGTYFVLNTYRLNSIRAYGTGGTQSSLYYADNPFNHRDNPCYMELTKTPAQLIALIDTSQHTHITLPVFPGNDTAESTVNHVFQTIHIAYAVAHEVTSDYSWVTYTDSGYGIHTVLVDLDLDEIISLL